MMTRPLPHELPWANLDSGFPEGAGTTLSLPASELVKLVPELSASDPSEVFLLIARPCAEELGPAGSKLRVEPAVSSMPDPPDPTELTVSSWLAAIELEALRGLLSGCGMKAGKPAAALVCSAAWPLCRLASEKG